jgi:hypothetical protein
MLGSFAGRRAALCWVREQGVRSGGAAAYLALQPRAASVLQIAGAHRADITLQSIVRAQCRAETLLGG